MRGPADLEQSPMRRQAATVAIGQLPAAPGVYRFRDAQSRVLYIGRATSLRARVGSYWGDLGGRRHLARMVRAVDRIEAVACDSVHEAAWLERNLLEERMPRWNRTPGGQESACYLLLDAGARAPGLRMVHEPRAGRLFGPYLGGTRAREAISGLHRVHPLAYAGEALTGAERDLAAKRGVRPGDRIVLAAALAAVLERDPVAVAHARSALEQARDRAAQDLAFERAGRIQEELKAVDWITAPQRATTRDGGDATVHGWADGLLISFTIRGGRLCEWSQRRCSPATAAKRLAASPPAWAAFARRNAQLAATLT
jgi:excinuclease ABC subunit C